ncbi:MAG: GNAT family protein, partial [Pseudomonadota bacterium]
PELNTPRLALREVRLDDGPALQSYQNDPEQWKHQAVEPEEFADGTLRVQRYFEHCGPDNERRLFVYVAIDRTSGVLVGQVSLSRFHPAIASLGVGVDKTHTGKGIGTEMARELIRFGFDELGVHRISADVAVENEPCKRVMEKLGMTQEGVARDCIWAQGRWWTEVQFAILEQDPRG